VLQQPKKRKAESPPVTNGSIEDIPRLLDGIRGKLDGVEFAKVQLGVNDDERVVLESPKKQLVGSSPAQEDTVKARVLDKLRRDFLQRYPEVEVVHQFPDLKLEFDMKSWSFSEPIFSAVLLYSRYRKLVRDIPQVLLLCRFRL